MKKFVLDRYKPISSLVILDVAIRLQRLEQKYLPKTSVCFSIGEGKHK